MGNGNEDKSSNIGFLGHNGGNYDDYWQWYPDLSSQLVCNKRMAIWNTPG